MTMAKLSGTLPGYRHYFPPQLVAGDAHSPLEVMLVGVGGIGSQLVTGLGRMHCALRALGHPGFRLHAFDGDAVSPSNVGRQLFSLADVGRNKAETMVTRVNMFFGTHWEAHSVMADEATFGSIEPGRRAVAFLITAVDSGKARMLFARYRDLFEYVADAGNMQSTGQVILGTKTGGHAQPEVGCAVRALPCAVDLYGDLRAQDETAEQGPSCSVEEALVRQDLFVNQWVATCALEILWQGLRYGHIESHGAFVNLRTMTVRPLPVDPGVWAAMGWRSQPWHDDAALAVS